MDPEIQELLSLINEWKGVVTPEDFEKIMADEEAKKQLDAMDNGWGKLYNKANSQDLRIKIRDTALKRANNFGAYMAFITDSGRGDDAGIGALFHAKTFGQHKEVAVSTKSFKVCVAGFTTAYTLIESGKQAAGMIACLGSIKMFNHSKGNSFYEDFLMETIKKGVAMSKTVHEVSDVYKEARLKEPDINSDEGRIITCLFAKELSNSVLEFRDKELLKKQIGRCQACTRISWRKDYILLTHLLLSILHFEEYQYLSITAPHFLE